MITFLKNSFAYTWNSLDQMLTGTFDGNTERFTYDKAGRRTSIKNSHSHESYTYNKARALTKVEDHTLNQTLNYGYNANGQRTSLSDPIRRRHNLHKETMQGELLL